MRLIILPWNKQVNSPAPFLYFVVARGFPWRILRRRGCLWTSLFAVDQKANPAYPGFYNGGVTSWGMASGYGGRKSPSGVQGQSPSRGPGDDVPHKPRQNVKLV